MRRGGGESMINICLNTLRLVGINVKINPEDLTSFPVLTHPFTSWMSSLPIILKRMIRVRGSSTCSDVARSDLSFAFAYELGPFLFTLAPMTYG